MIRNIILTIFLVLSLSTAQAGLLDFLFDHHQKKDGPPIKKINIATIANAKPMFLAHPTYGNPQQYTVKSHTYHVLRSAKNYKQDGVASWYGTRFQGDLTSEGKYYNLFAMSAANKRLPIPYVCQGD